MLVPGTSGFGHREDVLASKESKGVATLARNLTSEIPYVTCNFRLITWHRSRIDNLSSKPSCIRADIDEVVGGTDDFLIVLHHYHGIAQRLQLLEHMDKTVSITGMESDARLIKDIE